MTKEFLQPKREVVLVEDKEKVLNRLSMRMMDQPELSLGPSVTTDTNANLCRKRKHTWDESMSTQTSIELHRSDPLPMDWEQCLDLQSGRMYYLNRKTLKKSWVRPREQKIDLDLNMSTIPSSEVKSIVSSNSTTAATHEQYPNNYTNSKSSMVAVACLNCHLLVMLSRSSPSCPNCKYVHSLAPSQPQNSEAVKSLETLSLLR
ncbi:uncharacterized protein A4U43_C09F5460 [Asparagus officinalis]|uniref:WW domain-containing protein n=1 Tax=Asparagus officinalis TaxID=4686 RepID=A0A5P1E7B3_ASPOF|nr:uncharacterized protein LOC109824461 [Asparagus officinalis]ONK57903.1 uncharacterized protein A4U43_C09F5460 [Asparagus officinalis]